MDQVGKTKWRTQFVEYMKLVEGVRLNAYPSKEGGLPTIGIGHKF